VDHVQRGEIELDGLVDREVERVDRDLAAGVAVLPVELVRLDPDRQVLLVLDSSRLDGGDLREREDRDCREDDGRDRRPDDLEPGVPVDLWALGALRRVAPAAKADDEEDERRLDEDEDKGADPEDDPVQAADRLPARGVGRGRADSSGSCESRARSDERRKQGG
jgi:hypothetical protein